MEVSKTVVFSHDGDLADHIKGCEHDILWEIVQKHVQPGAKILEAGAGSGRWLAFLANHGYKMVGVELNAKSVERFIVYFPNIRYDVGDVTVLPYPDEDFDAVLSLGVLEHFVDGAGLALKEMNRVLKDGRSAFISVPFANSIWKIEKLKDKIVYQILGSNFLRRLLKRKARTYNMREQEEYFDKLSRHLIKEIDFKLRFDPSEGITFYEYRFQVNKFLELIKKHGFHPSDIYLEYSEQRLYQVFGFLVGKYTPGKGVTLNSLGAFISSVIPKRWIAHMIIAVATKSKTKNVE